MKTQDFELSDQDGNIHSLSQYKGKWIVLYFYPKDDTPGCTKEACNFRDSLQDLKDAGAVVLGVSKDSVSSHQKFAKKYHLNFPILSDEDKKVIKAYKAWGEKSFMGKAFEGTLRITYLIDPEGKISKIFKDVKPLIHAKEILASIHEAGN